MAPVEVLRLSRSTLFNKPRPEIMTMSFLRISLLCTTLIAGTALAQNLPSGLTRNGDVVMMQPIPDVATAIGRTTGTVPPVAMQTIYTAYAHLEHLARQGELEPRYVRTADQPESEE